MPPNEQEPGTGDQGGWGANEMPPGSSDDSASAATSLAAPSPTEPDLGYNHDPGSAGQSAVLNGKASRSPELDGDGGRMTIWEHLAELRKRIFICAVAVVVTSIAGYFLYNPVLHFMTGPYRAFYAHHKGMITSKLVITSPTEGFTTRLKVAMYIGVALAAPVWLWELWRFITPGLKQNEKRYAVPFLLSALTLFAMGVTVAILVWPKAIDWLIGASGSGVAPLFTPYGYVHIYVLICLVFGVVFLYPIVVVFLMIARIVPTAKWRKWRRPAIVVLFSVAAIATPSNDPFSFLGMAVPMVILYELSIIVGRLLGR
jgi:sec-independent protein translocase protein TatC